MRKKLVPYTLKLEPAMWRQIDINRRSMVGLLGGEAITKVDYIRHALMAYNQYFEDQIQPRVKAVKEEIEPPLGFYYSNGTDVPW